MAASKRSTDCMHVFNQVHADHYLLSLSYPNFHFYVFTSNLTIIYSLFNLFVKFDPLRLSQHFFSHVGMG